MERAASGVGTVAPREPLICCIDVGVAGFFMRSNMITIETMMTMPLIPTVNALRQLKLGGA